MVMMVLSLLLSSSMALALENSITGNMVFSQNPNEFQKVYFKSAPAIARLNIYYEYDVFLPKPKNIDFKHSFDWEYPSYEDLTVRMDNGVNGFDDLFGESFWDKFYAGKYLSSDELGNTYTTELNSNDINTLKEDFYGFHEGVLPLAGGTGFFINSEGYLLTNAHVATLLDSEIEEVTELILYSNYLDYYYFLYDNANYNDNILMTEFEDLTKKYLFIQENMEITNLRIGKIEVILGEGSNVKKYNARLVDFNENYLSETGGRDWALLKIDGETFPSLPLGNSDSVPIGEDITVIGYPWTSEGITERDDEYVSSTPTSGRVSNFVPSGNYKDIQIDISIEEGNSGGPGLNSNGEVIGIATAGYEGLSGTYNYLTPINDIKKEIGVDFKQSRIDTLWSEGLENFWGKNYATARSQFEEVKSISPNHPYVQGILKQFDDLPNEDKEKPYENLEVKTDNSNGDHFSFAKEYLSS